tara:strand:- start:17703 stop:18908 length:1206 start_codon:yes stop_codon:yes gene_type:complete
MENIKSYSSVVMGSYINAYCIASELRAFDETNIALLYSKKSYCNFSNKFNSKIKYISEEGLLNALKSLSLKYKYLILFPTDDLQLRLLANIYEEIKDFCYLPMNPKTFQRLEDKFYQYNLCEKLDISYPKSIKVSLANELDSISLRFPFILKPTIREDIDTEVFRSLLIESASDLHKNKIMLENFIKQGIKFIASEYIPGEDNKIYAYTCFKTLDGDIKGEWVGRKLTQFRDNFGVFASAVNTQSSVLIDLGRKIASNIDYHGIIEPEFKYDERDNQFKLMEINLRSMMWHKVGFNSGVYLHKNLLDYALQREFEVTSQSHISRTNLVFLPNEFSNLILKKNHLLKFYKILTQGDRVDFIGYSFSDKRVILFSIFDLAVKVSSACLRLLKTGLKLVFKEKS